MINLLDFVFPKRCVSCGKFSEYICLECKRKIEMVENPICPICQRQAIGGKTHPGCRTRFGLDGLVVAFRYKGPLKLAVSRIKYKWIYDIGNSLVDILSENIWRFDFPGDYVLIPVPLHARRKSWRGFNQAEILVGIISRKFKVKYSCFLNRVANTQTQVGLDREQRLKNVKGAFKLIDTVTQHQIKGKDFILVDDVYTSGATMAECAKVLKGAGAGSVWGMVLALG